MPNYLTYPEYSNSGIDWLGGVPRHWEYFRLRFLLAENFANGLFKKSHFWGEGIKIVNVGDVYTENDMVSQANLDRVDCNDDELEKYQVQNGDFFVVRSSLKLQGIGKSAVILHPEETTVFECHLIRGRPTGFVHPRFLNLLLNSHYSREYFVANANVVTMATIDQNKLKDIELFIPEYEEQQTIARFLDHKTRQIDQLIAKKQTLIDKLNEQRIALITHAVTKGLNPDVEMKDSGVEWLGDVPKHWDVRRLKFVTESFGGGTPNTAIDLYWNGDIPWVSPKDMKSRKITQTQDNITQLGLEESTSRMINENTVLIVVRSGILRHSIPVAINLVPVSINQDMKALVPNESLLSPHYLQFFIEGNQKDLLDAWSKQGCTVESIESDYMLNSVMVLPPVEEQTQIVEYLDGKMARIDRMIELNQRTIDKLKEYRTALITAAVTGKIDVRNWQQEKYNHATP